MNKMISYLIFNNKLKSFFKSGKDVRAQTLGLIISQFTNKPVKCINR